MVRERPLHEGRCRSAMSESGEQERPAAESSRWKWELGFKAYRLTLCALSILAAVMIDARTPDFSVPAQVYSALAGAFAGPDLAKLFLKR